MGVLIRGGTGHKVSNSVVENILFHKNSGRPNEKPNHISGIYLASSGNTVENSKVTNITSNGILVYNVPQKPEPTHSIIANNDISKCKRDIQVGSGSAHLIKGNTIRNTDMGVYVSQMSTAAVILENTFYLNHLSVLINSVGSKDHKVFDNIIYGNGAKDSSVGVMVKDAKVSINNNLFYNNLAAIQYDGKVKKIAGNSYNSKPLFVDPDKLDFRLKKSTPLELRLGPTRYRQTEN